MPGAKRCIDCAEGSKRKAPYPGPRCATHHREKLKRMRAMSHSAAIEARYGLSAEDYLRILKAQDGRCYICQRATGRKKHLSVDHDHKTGFVRGLLCQPCNRMLGHARDQIEFFERAIVYLTEPPAQSLGIWAKPEEG